MSARAALVIALVAALVLTLAQFGLATPTPAAAPPVATTAPPA
jgi:hypothetical protein